MSGLWATWIMARTMPARRTLRSTWARGVASEERHRRVVGQLDTVIADDEEGLGSGGEQPLGTEARDHGGGLALEHRPLRIGCSSEDLRLAPGTGERDPLLPRRPLRERTDRGATAAAGPPSTAVDPELVAGSPIVGRDAPATVAVPLHQRPHELDERRRILDRPDRGARIDAGEEAHLGPIHVAGAGHDRLVDERDADRSLG
jgi:hypothetical protein